MFLKKLLSINAKTETLAHKTSTYSMYNVVFENKNATKIVFFQPLEQCLFLKKVKHDVIINIYKLNLDKKYIVTKRLLPFDFIFKRETLEFNKYIFFKIAEALDFIHSRCGVIHRNIQKESLFFTEEGGIVLGGFERSKESNEFGEDSIMFSSLISKLLGINASFADFIINKGFGSDMFFDMEVAFFGYRAYTTNQKMQFMENVRKNKAMFVGIYKHRIAWMVLGDINEKCSKELKLHVVDFILNMDMCDIDKLLIPLFQMLDTNVRFSLLRNSGKYITEISTLDPIASSLSLGIKCKDKLLREETIVFIRDNIQLLSQKQQMEILGVMHDYVSDERGMMHVIAFLQSSKHVFKKTDAIYKILCKYLVQSKYKNVVISAIENFYESFDNFRMTTELLPLLCGHLSDRQVQTDVFLLIEKILRHLKEHKSEIISHEWKIANITNMFKQKTIDEKLLAASLSQTVLNGPSSLNNDSNDAAINIIDKEAPLSDWDDPW
ncbi:hypothetical protein CWI42_040160 [Ordospora colligata]|uniref:Protein kinase domain-containing protein n=1 Tax=Ordospora colligata OC4 TaxID=1354746 RepID=A0A0B2UKS6_9MICR|nr:uncharacterized protein M896_040160 [Ordospora colligata OC4]KHN69824.1 hypothetical protein M896_040160 [Ordospora colligata OC4]TBU15994.1 hypothetical protein CWI41_040160 [Ordospora colligata]TBU16207.1 hypothetical protein CWI40_040160 [Ordospora colligata]TBU18911.1 hypothetical protein CWI42_040160 [Ordospora colligata]